jgi:tetratricopeptide (TPR) repeat protein
MISRAGQKGELGVMKTMACLMLVMVLVVGTAGSAAAMHKATMTTLDAAGSSVVDAAVRFDHHIDHLLNDSLVKTCSDKGLTEYYRGNRNEAVASFTGCIEKGLISDRMYFFRGRTYMELGDTKKALQDFSRAVELNPRSTEALSKRAVLYQQTGEVEAAQRDVTAVLDLGGDAKAMTTVLRVQGKVYQSEGKNDLARISFDRAAKIDPSLKRLRIWSSYLNPEEGRHLGMLALLVLPALLIFKLDLPAPKKRD